LAALEYCNVDSEQPLISVVVAVLDNAATLERCLESVSAQTLRRVELIVMDGGSTDGGVEILRRHAPRIAYWESQRDRGLYHAFNKALAKARGEWLYFLGADDYLWDASVFERIAPHLAAARPEHRIVYGQANFVSARGEILEVLGRPWSEFRGRFLQGFMLPHQAVFHHRSLFEARGVFNEEVRIGGDYELLLRELKERPAHFVPDMVVAGYQFGGGSSEPRNSLKILQVVRRAQQLNGITPGLLWYAAAARTWLRVALWKVLGEQGAKRLLDRGRALLGKPPFWTRV